MGYFPAGKFAVAAAGRVGFAAVGYWGICLARGPTWERWVEEELEAKR